MVYALRPFPHRSVDESEIIGIDCRKGRGIILPGGALEPGETFVDCARRELAEEAGIGVPNIRMSLVCQGLIPNGFYVYGFRLHVNPRLAPIGEDLGSGKIVKTTWSVLRANKHFGAFYDLMYLSEVERLIRL